MNNREFEQKKAKRDRRTAVIGATAVFGVLIALYAVLTDLTHALDPVLFPGLGVILPEMARSSGELLKGFLYSMRLLIPSLAAGILAGVACGLAVGMHPKVKLVLMPLFRALNPVPPTMLIPYAIAVLPSFWLSSAVIIFLVAVAIDMTPLDNYAETVHSALGTAAILPGIVLLLFFYVAAFFTTCANKNKLHSELWWDIWWF